MQKKKIIILSVLMFVLVAAGVLGAFLMFNNKEVEPTGNKANIDWYTEDGDEFIISTEEELYGLVKLSEYYDFSGQTIKLGADIVLNDGNAKDWAKEAPSKRWYPIDGFAGTFDGQGHSISGVYGYAVDSPMGLFANTKMNCIIKDFKVLNSYFEVDGLKAVGSVVSNGCGTFEKLYSDAFVTCNGENAGGLIGNINADGTVSATAKSSKMTNCWFDGTVTMRTKTGRYGGGLIGRIFGGSLTLSHCLNTGDVSAESEESNGIYIGGIFGAMTYTNFSGAVIVEDTLNAGKITAKKTTATGSLAGGTLANTTMSIKDTYVTEASYTDVCSYQKSSTTGSAMMVNTDFVQGEEWYSWTTLDYEQYWTVTKDSTPILRYFAEEVVDTSALEKMYNFDWYNQYAQESIIDSVEDLYGFAIMSYSDNFTSKVIKLGADIVVNEGKASEWASGKKVPDKHWIPIGRINAFQGIFDGNGYTISGLYGQSANAFVGLFGWNGIHSEIKNVKVVNSYFEATGALGSITGRCEGKIDTVYSDAYLKEHASLAGGIAGYKLTDNVSTLTNCWFDGVLTLEGNNAKNSGGIVGRLIKGTLEMDSCLFSGKIVITGEKRTANIGGFIGQIAAGTVNIQSSLNSGEFVVTEAEKMNAVGRVFGQVTNTEDVNITIDDSYFTSEGYSATYFYYCAGDKPTVKGCAELKRREDILGYDGYRTTALDYGKYWTVVVNEDGTPILKSFAKKVPSVAGLEKTFDKSWYSHDKNSFVLKDAKDLYGFLYISNSKNDFKGKTVVLANDIQLNAGSVAEWKDNKNVPGNAYNWGGVGKYTNFQGTFDGQGHTVSGLYAQSDTSYLGLFAHVGVEGNVQNVRLTNSYLEATKEGGAVGSIAGRLEGKIHTVYSDAIIKTSTSLNGGIVGYKLTKDTKSSVTNSWYAGTMYMIGDDAKHSGGIVGRVINGEMELNSCLFTGTIVIEGATRSANTGGLVGNINGTLILKSCLNNGVFEVTEAEKMNSTSRIVGQVSNVDTAKLIIENTYATNKGDNGKIFYYNTGNKATIEGYAEIKEEVDILGYQGYIATALDFDNYWTVVLNADGTPVLKSFASSVPSVAGLEKNFDISWYDEKKDTYVLTDRKDLYGFAALSNSNINFKGKTITLGNSITVNETGTAADWAAGTVPTYAWNPIGRYTKFAGTFDGKGYTISGICALSDADYMGFFSHVDSSGMVKNLSLTNSYLQTLNESGSLGSVVGRLDGDIHTVYSDAILTSTTPNNGGIAGYKNSKTKGAITNCWYAGTMNVSDINSGGIIGKIISGPLTIDNCLFSGTINLDKMSSTVLAGGLIGEVPAEHELKITDSLVTGKFVKLSDNTMTAIGRIAGYNKGTIETENVYFVQKDSVTKSRWYSPESATLKGTLPKEVAEDDIKGEYGYYYTELDFNQYWTTVLDNTTTTGVDESGAPILQSFATVVNAIPTPPSYASVEWYENGKPYEIKTAADLFGLAYLTRTGLTFAGEEIKVADGVEEITFNTTDTWEPIGWRKSFQGTFDGNGVTITGIHATTDSTYMGLFGWIGSEGEVKNLKLTKSYFESTAAGKEGSATGSIAGRMDGNIHNVYSEATVVSNTSLNGGIAGYKNSKNESQITNTWYAGTMELSGVINGGIIGKIINGPLILDNCLTTGTMNLYAMPQKKIKTGGFIGEVPKDHELDITNSLVAMEVVKKVDNAMTALCRVIGEAAGTIYGKDSYCINRDSVVTSRWYNNGASFTGTQVANRNEADIIGNLAYFNTTLDFSANGKWALVTTSVNVADGTPVLKDFVAADKVPAVPVVPDTVDITWYTGPKTNYEICRSATDNAQNVKELYGFAYLVNQGITFATRKVTMLYDVTVNEGTVAEWEARGFTNLTEWTPIGKNIAFNGEFNGGNHTINGLYGTASTEVMGLFGRTGAESVIKNLRFTNSYFSSSAGTMGSIAGYCEGDFHTIYSDVKLVSTAGLNGGLAGRHWSNSETSMTNCWYAGTMVLNASGNTAGNSGGLLGKALKGTVTITNCLFSGKISNPVSTSGNQRVGGFIGDTAGTIVITSSLNSGELDYKSGAVGVARLIGCIEKNTVSMSKVYFTDKGFSGGTAYVVKSGVSMTGKINDGDCVKVTEGEIKGNFAYFNTTLFEGESKDSWALVTSAVNGADGTPVLKSFVASDKVPALPNVPQNVDIQWYGGPKSNYTIANSATDNAQNVKELYGFAYLVNQGITFKDKEVKLINDVTVNNGTVAEWSANGFSNLTKWTPIGNSSSKKFNGTFDGQGKTISGLYITGTTRVGMFGWTNPNSMIRNFKLQESYIGCTGSGEGYVGSIVGRCDGSLHNVYSSATINSTRSINGGIAGLFFADSDNTISGCCYAGKMTVKAKYNGGIIGKLYSGVLEMSNCLFSGEISYSGISGNSRIGGFVGEVGKSANADEQITITNCLNTGKFVKTDTASVSGVGRVIGYGYSGSQITTENVYFTKVGESPAYAFYTDGTKKGTTVGLDTTAVVISDTVTVDTIKTTLNGFDFTDIWSIGTEIGDAPKLQMKLSN